MILVVVEHQQGRLTRASWEAVSAAQVFAQGTPVQIAILGHDIDALARELSTAAVASVLVVRHPALADYTADGYTHALTQLVAHASPRLLLFPHSYQTRDIAPRLAARLGAALVTDAVALEGTPADPVVLRPIFQGKLVARMKPSANVAAEPTLLMVSMQAASVRAEDVTRGSEVPLTSFAPHFDPTVIRQRVEAPFQAEQQAVDLGHAERIVAIGRGIRSQEHVVLAQSLATVLRAELAASRPICDNGWLPMDRQVGSSGQTVAPALYVAIGISGAVQHVVGMKGSRTVVAINKDPDAPIFETADYAIIGDLFEVLPALVAVLEQG